jgi:hypothetical protein
MKPQLFLGVTVVFFLSGCASITGSKNQPVSVTGMCEGQTVVGASCTATNDKGVSYLSTPGTAFVTKSTGDLSVSCTKGGSTSITSIVKSTSNTNIWGNVLLGGPIGAGVDAMTGAGFDYPPSVNVIFNSPCPR